MLDAATLSSNPLTTAPASTLVVTTLALLYSGQRPDFVTRHSSLLLAVFHTATRSIAFQLLQERLQLSVRFSASFSGPASPYTSCL